MVKRKKLLKRRGDGGNYFSKPRPLTFIPTGCQLLDLALGGGWAKNRIANIIGDKSTGKTLLMIEACANFAREFPKGRIIYRESEAAFDQSYAAALGMPIDRVDFGEEQLDTVEDFFEDLSKVMRTKTDCLYIIDSLDALSDRAELERNIDQPSYGGEKAKKMSQLFRRLARDIKRSNVTLLIVSQVRDKIGARFGRKTTRTGGRALDFYASQVLYLTQLGRLVKKFRKIKRPTGVRVLGFVDKNKISIPFREAEFVIKFGYGIDDQAASLNFLKQAGIQPNGDLNAQVEREWYALEEMFLPKKGKYV